MNGVNSGNVAACTIDTAALLPPPALAFPSDNASCVPSGILFEWNSAPTATSYRIQASLSPSFSPTICDTSGIISTTHAEAGLIEDSVYYWHVNATNGAGTSSWSTTWSFRTAPLEATSPAIVLPADNAVSITDSIAFTWRPRCNAITYHLQIALDTGFTNLFFEQTNIADTFRTVSGLSGGTRYYWRLHTIYVIGNSDWTARRTFTIASSSISFGVKKTWSLVSVPMTLADMRKTSVFPAATTSAFGYFSGGYVPAETLKNDYGYWLRYNADTTLTVSGVPCIRDTFPVQSGWNMIGSISVPVAVGNVGSIEPGLITTNFFQYNAAYTIADSIHPGHGYWVKVRQDGHLILSSLGLLPTAYRIRIIPDGELPPPPPGREIARAVYRIPSQFALEQNYPNPFNPVTVIRYQLPAVGAIHESPVHVTLKVFNVLGQEVATLVNEMKQPGEYTVTWDATGQPSGIYYYRLTAETFSEMKRLMLVK